MPEQVSELVARYLIKVFKTVRPVSYARTGKVKARHWYCVSLTHFYVALEVCFDLTLGFVESFMAKTAPPGTSNQIWGWNIALLSRIHNAINLHKHPWVTCHKTAPKPYWSTAGILQWVRLLVCSRSKWKITTISFHSFKIFLRGANISSGPLSYFPLICPVSWMKNRAGMISIVSSLFLLATVLINCVESLHFKVITTIL